CDPTVTARILLFFFTDTATTEIFALSLHDALPILYSKVGQLKFSRFIKHFYYFLKFRDFISSQIRVNFSKLKQVNPKIKGFRFLFKDSGHNRVRLKFQRLYLDLFVKASLPQLMSPLKNRYNNNKKLTRIVHFNRFGTKNRFDPFYKDFNKFKKDYSRNNKFKKDYSRNNKDNAFTVQKSHKRKFNFRKKQKTNVFLRLLLFLKYFK